MSWVLTQHLKCPRAEDCGAKQTPWINSCHLSTSIAKCFIRTASIIGSETYLSFIRQCLKTSSLLMVKYVLT